MKEEALVPFKWAYIRTVIRDRRNEGHEWYSGDGQGLEDLRTAIGTKGMVMYGKQYRLYFM